MWAVRYRGCDSEVNSFLTRVEGAHSVSLVVDIQSRVPIMARDSLKETWQWADSRTEERDGFALIFWDGVPPMDKGGVRRAFEDQFPGAVTVVSDETKTDNEPGTGETVFNEWVSELDDSGDSGEVLIAETSRGVSVTLRNLHFQPDLPILLPDDLPLLDSMAEILTRIPERTILIRGHTADVGRPEDQYNLSRERAKTVADELALRGIDSRRLIYEGVGADEPLAPNDTDEGRRRNRRVEFLILED
jgi:outer membrane protein OmpA-like peptidoglycan-associated protein